MTNLSASRKMSITKEPPTARLSICFQIVCQSIFGLVHAPGRQCLEWDGIWSRSSARFVFFPSIDSSRLPLVGSYTHITCHAHFCTWDNSGTKKIILMAGTRNIDSSATTFKLSTRSAFMRSFKPRHLNSKLHSE